MQRASQFPSASHMHIPSCAVKRSVGTRVEPHAPQGKGDLVFGEARCEGRTDRWGWACLCSVGGGAGSCSFMGHVGIGHRKSVRKVNHGVLTVVCAKGYRYSMYKY